MQLVVPGTTSTGRAQVEPTFEVDPSSRRDVWLRKRTAFLPQQLRVLDVCCIVCDARKGPLWLGRLTPDEVGQLDSMIVSWVDDTP